MSEESAEARVGTVLRGKWTLERVLGVGGMGAVYVGLHKIGRRDAIKILHPEVARSREVRARFEQEAHAANRFSHPGAVEVRDMDTADDGSPFLVMELLEGESLADLAERLGEVSSEDALRFTDELLDVLVAAHERGIVHRDIKPENLFVVTGGRLKLLDFGIARMKEGAPQTLHTKFGAALGTISYMCPEQVRGLPIDARADLFATGATLFRLLARRRLHDARSDSELLVKMATEAAPPLASVAPAVPPGVCLIVDRALAYDRERRYPDARTMQGDVRALLRGEPPPHASARVAAGDVPNPVLDSTRADSAGRAAVAPALNATRVGEGAAAPAVRASAAREAVTMGAPAGPRADVTGARAPAGPRADATGAEAPAGPRAEAAPLHGVATSWNASAHARSADQTVRNTAAVAAPSSRAQRRALAPGAANVRSWHIVGIAVLVALAAFILWRGLAALGSNDDEDGDPTTATSSAGATPGGRGRTRDQNERKERGKDEREREKQREKDRKAREKELERERREEER